MKNKYSISGDKNYACPRVLDLGFAHLKIHLQASEIRSSMYGHKIRQTGFVLIYSPTFFVLAQNLARAKFRKKNY